MKRRWSVPCSFQRIKRKRWQRDRTAFEVRPSVSRLSPVRNHLQLHSFILRYSLKFSITLIVSVGNVYKVFNEIYLPSGLKMWKRLRRTFSRRGRRRPNVPQRAQASSSGIHIPAPDGTKGKEVLTTRVVLLDGTDISVDVRVSNFIHPYGLGLYHTQVVKDDVFCQYVGCIRQFIVWKRNLSLRKNDSGRAVWPERQLGAAMPVLKIWQFIAIHCA